MLHAAISASSLGLPPTSTSAPESTGQPRYQSPSRASAAAFASDSQEVVSISSNGNEDGEADRAVATTRALSSKPGLVFTNLTPLTLHATTARTLQTDIFPPGPSTSMGGRTLYFKCAGCVSEKYSGHMRSLRRCDEEGRETWVATNSENSLYDGHTHAKPAMCRRQRLSRQVRMRL